jgi:hypothetical protein
MKIKPFRSYDEHDVVNLYSLTQDSGNAGDLVQLQSMTPGDLDGYDANYQLSPFAGSDILRYVNKSKVALATDINLVLGALLWDVRTNDALGRPLIFESQRWNELQVVYSGQTVPVVTRGILVVSGMSGAPAPGSGIGVGATAGQWLVQGPAVTPSLGKWLSTTGADGFAFAYLKV